MPQSPNIRNLRGSLRRRIQNTPATAPHPVAELNEKLSTICRITTDEEASPLLQELTRMVEENETHEQTSGGDDNGPPPREKLDFNGSELDHSDHSENDSEDNNSDTTPNGIEDFESLLRETKRPTLPLTSKIHFTHNGKPSSITLDQYRKVIQKEGRKLPSPKYHDIFKKATEYTIKYPFKADGDFNSQHQAIGKLITDPVFNKLWMKAKSGPLSYESHAIESRIHNSSIFMIDNQTQLDYEMAIVDHIIKVWVKPTGTDTQLASNLEQMELSCATPLVTALSLVRMETITGKGAAQGRLVQTDKFNTLAFRNKDPFETAHSFITRIETAADESNSLASGSLNSSDYTISEAIMRDKLASQLCQAAFDSETPYDRHLALFVHHELKPNVADHEKGLSASARAHPELNRWPGLRAKILQVKDEVERELALQRERKKVARVNRGAAVQNAPSPARVPPAQPRFSSAGAPRPSPGDQTNQNRFTNRLCQFCGIVHEDYTTCKYRKVKWPYKGIRDDDGEFVCQNCGKPGHKAKDCDNWCESGKDKWPEGYAHWGPATPQSTKDAYPNGPPGHGKERIATGAAATRRSTSTSNKTNNNHSPHWGSDDGKDRDDERGSVYHDPEEDHDEDPHTGCGVTRSAWNHPDALEGIEQYAA